MLGFDMDASSGSQDQSEKCNLYKLIYFVSCDRMRQIKSNMGPGALALVGMLPEIAAQKMLNLQRPRNRIPLDAGVHIPRLPNARSRMLQARFMHFHDFSYMFKFHESQYVNVCDELCCLLFLHLPVLKGPGL